MAAEQRQEWDEVIAVYFEFASPSYRQILTEEQRQRYDIDYTNIRWRYILRANDLCVSIILLQYCKVTLSPGGGAGQTCENWGREQTWGTTAGKTMLSINTLTYKTEYKTMK